MTALAISQLTDMQSKFVSMLVDGASQTEAARQAGYVAPNVAACALLKNPRVLAAIREETERTFATVAPLAVRTLIEAMKPVHPIQHRIKAADLILQRAGYDEKCNGSKGLGGRSLFEMTADELEQVAARLRQARASEEQNAQVNAPDVIEGTAKPLG